MNTEVGVDLKLTNAQVAQRVMGWKLYVGSDIPESAVSSTAIDPHLSGVWLDDKGTCHACEDCGDLPNFAEDIKSAFEMEEKIKELGLTLQYGVALAGIVDEAVGQDTVRLYDYVHASPLDRCKAALATIK